MRRVRANVATISSDPESVDEALGRSDHAQWKSAMQSEFDSLIENRTWELTDLPNGKRPIDCKWIFKLKRDTTSSAVRYKARLVVRGFSQQKGIDYQETYSPAVRYSSIRFLIAIAVKKQLRIRQLDAVTAFLNGEIEEEIYMLQPERFDDGSGRVCRLLKSLYGLKQASRAWNNKLDEVLATCELKRCDADLCVYYYVDGDNILILAVYVDDILIFTNNIMMETKLVNELKRNFRMKDLGEVSSVLGVTFTHNVEKKTISLDQEHYISKILDRFGMSNCNPISTPVDPNTFLTTEMGAKNDKEKDEMKQYPYQEAIGSLMYAAQLTRPDICYALAMLSRFNQNPGIPHWTAVKRVFRYLKGTINRKLVFRSSSTDLIGFCDADYARDVEQRRSMTGYIFMLSGAAISWCSKAQRTVALSTTEAELMALVSAAQEAFWLKRLENEIFIDSPRDITVYCDQQFIFAANQAHRHSNEILARKIEGKAYSVGVHFDQRKCG